MTGKDHGHETEPSSLQGLRFDSLSGAERERVLGRAFDYRGDVTLRLEDGSSVSGYVFSVEPPHLKLLPADPSAARVTIPLASVRGIEFSGRDTADGRSWEAWVKRWEERRMLREQGLDAPDIEPQPDEL